MAHPSAALAPRAPHPFVYTVLYFPFGALGGFVSVALTYLATRHGLSITEGAFLNATSLMMNWLKWLWAPLVDTTLSPAAWYLISTLLSGLGVAAMASIPLGHDTLPLLLAVIAGASLINTIVGMAVEAIMAEITPPEQRGRVSAWFQAGNLGGFGLGGGLGLLLLQRLPAPWMTGAIFAVAFAACCLGLRFVPGHGAREPRAPGPRVGALRGVLADLRSMVSNQGGLSSALLCFLPIGTGAAQGVLTQSVVAARWGATDDHVALVQGVLSGLVTTIGCFVGGALCERTHPRKVYAGTGLGLAVVAVIMAVTPSTPTQYIVWNLVYGWVVGLAYAAFTAVVLDAMGKGSAATKYNLFATLSNFPIWWVGLLLGYVADVHGAPVMLYAEAGLGVVGVLVFFAAAAGLRRTRLPLRAEEA